MRSLKILLPLIAAGAALAAVPRPRPRVRGALRPPRAPGLLPWWAPAQRWPYPSWSSGGSFGWEPGGGGYRRYNLLALPLAGPLLTNPFVLLPVKLLSVLLLGLVIAAGLFGSQVPSLNLSPTFVWVIWWVGTGVLRGAGGETPGP